MHLIVCLDDADGMLFNKRRQSSDKLLCSRILEKTAGSRLWMNEYSAKLFSGKTAPNICVDAAFLDKCEAGEWCFAETGELLAYTGKLESITVYRWNRRYPADVKFPARLLAGRAPTRKEDFPGNSHDTITEEVYIL